MALVMPAEGSLSESVPEVPPPESPLPLAVVMPVIVPAPGKVCPEMKVTWPVLLTLKLVPFTAIVLSVPLGYSVRVSRTSVLPSTSKVVAGLVVLMPILELFW